MADETLVPRETLDDSNPLDNIPLTQESRWGVIRKQTRKAGSCGNHMIQNLASIQEPT